MSEKLPKRTSARIRAIQSIYSEELLGKNGVEVSYPEWTEDNFISDFDSSLLDILVKNIKENQQEFDNIIAKYINKDWELSRINLVVLITARSAVCEFMYCPDISINTIIDEYTTITSYFAGNQEVNFINAILDKMSSNLRCQDPALPAPIP